MQGRWRDIDDDYELVVDGFDVSYQGVPVRHDFFEVVQEDGALTVELGIDDASQEDSFQRENINGLVIDPDGQFHAYSVKIASTFERADA